MLNYSVARLSPLRFLMQSLKKILVTLLAVSSLTAAALAQEQSESVKTRQRLNPENVNKTSDEILLEKLTSLLTPVGIRVSKSRLVDYSKAESHQFIRVNWEAYENAPEFVKPGDQSFRQSRKLTALEKKNLAGGVHQPRGVEERGEWLFVAAVNGGQELVWWTQIDDPRIFRAESADSEGHLSGQLLHKSSPTFSVEFPDDAQIKELRFYQFKRADAEPVLELVNTIPVN
jgi:hypothetical protein